MSRALLLPLALVFGFALALVPACRRGDGTTPSPNRPSRPTADVPVENAAESAGAAVGEAAGDGAEKPAE